MASYSKKQAILSRIGWKPENEHSSMPLSDSQPSKTTMPSFFKKQLFNPQIKALRRELTYDLTRSEGKSTDDPTEYS